MQYRRLPILVIIAAGWTASLTGSLTASQIRKPHRNPIIALLDPDGAAPADLVFGTDGARPADFDPAAIFGVPHAARGLLAVACAALALRHRAMPKAGARAEPRVTPRRLLARTGPLPAGLKPPASL